MYVFYTEDEYDEMTQAILKKRSKFSLNTNIGYYQELKDSLKIRRVKNTSLVRVGHIHDGGYIMADEFAKSGGIAYSFGISNEIAWDLDIARRGYNVFMYDMTVDRLPYEHEQLHFFREGIGSCRDEVRHLDTLENFIVRNGHENHHDMILKMDVEGAEWDFLENVSSATLNQFNQIVFEFHSLTADKNFAEMDRTINLIDKISATHTLIHLHGNNYKPFVGFENIGVIPEVLELTYLRTASHTFEDDTEIFLPTSLDSPNNEDVPDITLGYWNDFERM